MSTAILIEQTAHGHAAALWRDGRLDDLLIDGPPGGTPRPGEIHVARIDRPLKGLGGALVSLGGGQTGFLRDAGGAVPGQHVLVQVTTHAETGKSAPVTRRILFKSRYVIITPDAPGVNVARTIRDPARQAALRALAGSANYGIILRSACEHADDGDIAADIRATAAQAAEVLADAGNAPALLLDGPGAELSAWRDWPADAQVFAERGAFERFDLWSAIEALGRPRADLPGGAWMAIEPVAALVAVDVNSGADTSPAACLKANIAAARDLPRQLRLRGLGGQVLVDFAPMSKADRREVEGVLRAALKRDPVETSLAGWSNLGLGELVRKRERRPITEVI